MDCTIEGRTLAKAARAVKSIAGSSYMPALRHTRIDTDTEGIEMNATNLETWIRYRIDAATGCAYEVAHTFIEADRLAGAVKSLKGSQHVRLDEGVLQIGGATIAGAEDIEADYPELPAFGRSHDVMSWSGAEFKAIVKRFNATGKKAGQTTRLNLTCANVEYNDAGTGARFVTTDGYSLNCEAYGEALPSVTVKRAGDESIATHDIRGALVPIDALIKCASAASMSDVVQLGFIDALPDPYNQHGMKYARIRITSRAGSIHYWIRTIAEDFPDFQRVIPKASSATASITVDPADLARITSAAREVAPDDTRAVTLTIEADGGYNFAGAPALSLRVSAESIAGSYSEVIDILSRNNYANASIEATVFSADYLKALAGFGSAPITLHFQGPLQALRIDYGPEQVAVLMPLNLKK